MKIKCKITFLFNHDGASLELYDETSGIAFIRLKMNQEQICKMFSRLAYCDTESAEVVGLNNVGKKQEIDKLEFELPENADYFNNQEIALNIVDSLCPEGWEADHYFGSRNSFFDRDGKKFARCTIRRWV